MGIWLSPSFLSPDREESIISWLLLKIFYASYFLLWRLNSSLPKRWLGFQFNFPVKKVFCSKSLEMSVMEARKASIFLKRAHCGVSRKVFFLFLKRFRREEYLSVEELEGRGRMCHYSRPWMSSDAEVIFPFLFWFIYKWIKVWSNSQHRAALKIKADLSFLCRYAYTVKHIMSPIYQDFWLFWFWFDVECSLFFPAYAVPPSLCVGFPAPPP